MSNTVTMPRRPCVFIQSNEKQLVGALVSAYSLKRNSKQPDAFDVEIVVMYPWAASFAKVLHIDPDLGQRMFIGVGIFMALVFVGYLYDIAKGVLKWD